MASIDWANLWDDGSEDDEDYDPLKDDDVSQFRMHAPRFNLLPARCMDCLYMEKATMPSLLPCYNVESHKPAAMPSLPSAFDSRTSRAGPKRNASDELPRPCLSCPPLS